MIFDKKPFRKIFPQYLPKHFNVVETDENGNYTENTIYPRITELISAIARLTDEEFQININEFYETNDLDSKIYRYNFKGKVKFITDNENLLLFNEQKIIIPIKVNTTNMFYGKENKLLKFTLQTNVYRGEVYDFINDLSLATNNNVKYLYNKNNKEYIISYNNTTSSWDLLTTLKGDIIKRTIDGLYYYKVNNIGNTNLDYLKFKDLINFFQEIKLNDRDYIYNEDDEKYYLYIQKLFSVVNYELLELNDINNFANDDTVLFPIAGDRYIIKNGINGFEGYDNFIAEYDGVNWQFYYPIIKSYCLNLNDNKKYYFFQNNWIEENIFNTLEDDFTHYSKDINVYKDDTELENRKELYINLLTSQIGEDINSYQWLDINKNFFIKNIIQLYKRKGLESSLNLWTKLATQNIKALDDLWTFDYCHFYSLYLLILWTHKTSYNKFVLSDGTVVDLSVSDDLYNQIKNYYLNIKYLDHYIWEYRLYIKKWKSFGISDNSIQADIGFKFNDLIPDSCCGKDNTCNQNDNAVLVLTSEMEDTQFNEQPPIESDNNNYIDYGGLYFTEYPLPKNINDSDVCNLIKQNENLTNQIMKEINEHLEHRVYFPTPHFRVYLELNPNNILITINELLNILITKYKEYKPAHTVLHLYILYSLKDINNINLSCNTIMKLLLQANTTLIHFSTHLFQSTKMNDDNYIMQPILSDSNENTDNYYYTNNWSLMEAYGDYLLFYSFDTNLGLNSYLNILIQYPGFNTTIIINSLINIILKIMTTANLVHEIENLTDIGLETDSGITTDGANSFIFMSTELAINTY